MVIFVLIMFIFKDLVLGVYFVCGLLSAIGALFVTITYGLVKELRSKTSMRIVFCIGLCDLFFSLKFFMTYIFGAGTFFFLNRFSFKRRLKQFGHLFLRRYISRIHYRNWQQLSGNFGELEESVGTLSFL